VVKEWVREVVVESSDKDGFGESTKAPMRDFFVHNVLERGRIGTKSANCDVLVSFNFVECNGVRE
jgi:hypothetical protein